MSTVCTKRDFTVGMMRGKGKPGAVALANALSAESIGGKLYFFNPSNVNIREKNIDALHYEGGMWRPEVINYPDVIDNDELSRYSKEVWSHVTSEVPVTTHILGGKLKIMNGMEKHGIYPELMIPTSVVRNFSGFLRNLHEYKKVILKPIRGSMGKDVYYFEKVDSCYISDVYGVIDKSQLEDFYSRRIRGRNFLQQKYIASKTKNNLPFDIRLHVRRDHAAQWKTVKIYARIGSGRTAASNLSAGGSIALSGVFLNAQFGNNGRAIHRSLQVLASKFPIEFQKLYPDCEIDALGVDLGLDENGRPWLFEVNSFPGSMFFELEDAIPRMGFAKYLALGKKIV